MIGESVGPYRVLEKLGAGGMGEVYRARDTRLDRDVAIKRSATQFSERFTREARAIAALNHSNICHLYDVGPDYLVLEYVEGTHPAGPMSFDDARPIISQLIDGIEAAHEKGIIHRDLKYGEHQDHARRRGEDSRLRPGESGGAPGQDGAAPRAA